MKAPVNKVHFIGIGGIGMSALARYFLSEGWKVSGSDLSPSSITTELKKEGAVIYTGKQSANNVRRSAPTLVVYNNAIRTDNPEFTEAKKMGLAIRSYPEVVGELTKKYKTIALAGSHGKSTTTAMTALILMEAGYDPTVIIGTKLKEFSPVVIASEAKRSYKSANVRSPRHSVPRDDRYAVNFRKGKSGWLVLEADEWKAAFLNYHPYVATITNIDAEHLDFYKNFANVKKTFEEFRKRCGKVVERPKDGKLVTEIKKVLQIPGDHNVSNALNAYAVADYIGIPKKTILKALGKYQGAWRRMEYRGIMKHKTRNTEHNKSKNMLYVPSSKIHVFDDYAHHPSEIKATLAAFKQKWPKNPLICVFQAHQADRLRRLFSGFKTAFKVADRVVILPEYKVAGREEVFDKNHNAKALAKAIGAEYLENPKDLKMALRRHVSSLYSKSYILNPIIVMMGAGDIINFTDELVK